MPYNNRKPKTKQVKKDKKPDFSPAQAGELVELF